MAADGLGHDQKEPNVANHYCVRRPLCNGPPGNVFWWKEPGGQRGRGGGRDIGQRGGRGRGQGGGRGRGQGGGRGRGQDAWRGRWGRGRAGKYILYFH